MLESSSRRTKESLAEAIFRNMFEEARLEDVIYWFLKDKFENGIEDIKSFDSYDTSIEFWIQKGTTLDRGDRRVLSKLGFARCWLCVRDGTKDDEVYYEL